MKTTHAFTFVLEKSSLLMIFFISSLALSQTYRNGGTLNNTGTMSVNTFQNWKNANPGTLNNTGSVSATSTFTNDFSSATVNNNSAGLIDVTGASSTYTNGVGSTANNSGATIKIANTITNGTGSINTTAGTFEYEGTSAQTVLAGVVSNLYGNLTITGSSAKTLGGAITVDTLITVNTGATFAVGTSNTLTVNGASPFTINGTGSVDAAASGATVVYNRSGNQTVLGGSGINSYVNLSLQNSGTKTASGGITLSGSGTLTNAASTTFDLAANSLTTASGTTISNNNIIQTAGSVSFGATHTIGGTFIYQGTSGSQTVGAANYANLTLQDAATKSVPAGVSVSGSYSVAGGARSYAGTFTYGAGDGSVQSVIGGESYVSLTIAGATDTSSASYKVATGTFTVSSGLTVNSGNTLDMGTFTINSLDTSLSTNSGKVRWAASNVFVKGSGMTEFYGSSAGSVAASGTGTSIYGNMMFGGSGTKTISGSVTATGGTAAFGVTVSDNLTIGGSGSLTVLAMDFNNDGTVTNNGAITVN